MSDYDRDQQTLAFTAALNHALRLVDRIAGQPREAEFHERDEAGVIVRSWREWLSAGRVRGVIEILQRLLLFGREIGADAAVVAAQVSAIAARIQNRKSVGERTVRNWTRDAVALGLLHVDYRSAQYGGTSWNVYTILFGKIRDLTNAEPSVAGRNGAATGGNDFRPWGGNDCRPIKSLIGREEIKQSIEPTLSRSDSPSPPQAASVAAPRLPPRPQNTLDSQVTSPTARFVLERIRAKLRIRPRSDQDVDLVVKVALLCERGEIEPESVYHSLSAVEKFKPQNQIAYFRTCLDYRCDGRLSELLDEIESATAR